MTGTKTISLNADIGESFGAWVMGADELIMPHIDCANVACGFHAADPLTMSRTLQLAKEHKVSVGAHPSYPDLVGFGRRHMACSAEEVTAMVQYQVGALQALAAGRQMSVDYVKPHGALYNDMLSDGNTFDAICEAIKALQRDDQVPLMIMATPHNQAWRKRAEEHGVTLIFEGFADRAYDDNGHLRSRQYSDAVFQNDEQIIEQAQRFNNGEKIKSVNGELLDIQIDSLCVHGDNPQAISTIKHIRSLLTKNPESNNQ
ncbi:5-oxoprolinase subunit PxpA [Idiomarina seosinensis]|uniref:5-oxoprolinase subunit PxpA n=1 Tax=Idiomarina seosinensis TaxID=281739 RepID=UPI0038515277